MSRILRLQTGCEIVACADDTALIVKAREFKTFKERGKTDALFFGKKIRQERPKG